MLNLNTYFIPSSKNKASHKYIPNILVTLANEATVKICNTYHRPMPYTQSIYDYLEKILTIVTLRNFSNTILAQQLNFLLVLYGSKLHSKRHVRNEKVF